MYIIKIGNMESIEKMTKVANCPKCCSTLSYNGYDVIVAYDAPDGSMTMGIRCPVCGEYIPLKFNEVNDYDY